MVSLRWTEGAVWDLWEIVEYVSRDSPGRGLAVGERIKSAAEPLRQFPRLGRVVPRYEIDRLRELIVDNYRLVYVVYSDRVEVLAVAHGSRDLYEHLGPEPLSSS